MAKRKTLKYKAEYRYEDERVRSNLRVHECFNSDGVAYNEAAETYVS